MKVLIISKFNCQSFPLNDNAIEVSEDDLKQIGISKCFDVENNCIIDYDNSKEVEEEKKQTRIAEIKHRLEELNKDFIQSMIGAVIPDIEEKRAEFISLHNELRELEGKEPREYN